MTAAVGFGLYLGSGSAHAEPRNEGSDHTSPTSSQLTQARHRQPEPASDAQLSKLVGGSRQAPEAPAPKSVGVQVDRSSVVPNLGKQAGAAVKTVNHAVDAATDAAPAQPRQPSRQPAGGNGNASSTTGAEPTQQKDPARPAGAGQAADTPGDASSYVPRHAATDPSQPESSREAAPRRAAEPTSGVEEPADHGKVGVAHRSAEKSTQQGNSGNPASTPTKIIKVVDEAAEPSPTKINLDDVTKIANGQNSKINKLAEPGQTPKIIKARETDIDKAVDRGDQAPQAPAAKHLTEVLDRAPEAAIGSEQEVRSAAATPNSVAERGPTHRGSGNDKAPERQVSGVAAAAHESASETTRTTLGADSARSVGAPADDRTPDRLPRSAHDQVDALAATVGGKAESVLRTTPVSDSGHQSEPDPGVSDVRHATASAVEPVPTVLDSVGEIADQTGAVIDTTGDKIGSRAPLVAPAGETVSSTGEVLTSVGDVAERTSNLTRSAQGVLRKGDPERIDDVVHSTVEVVGPVQDAVAGDLAERTVDPIVDLPGGATALLESTAQSPGTAVVGVAGSVQEITQIAPIRDHPVLPAEEAALTPDEVGRSVERVLSPTQRLQGAGSQTSSPQTHGRTPASAVTASGTETAQGRQVLRVLDATSTEAPTPGPRPADSRIVQRVPGASGDTTPAGRYIDRPLFISQSAEGATTPSLDGSQPAESSTRPAVQPFAAWSGSGDHSSRTGGGYDASSGASSGSGAGSVYATPVAETLHTAQREMTGTGYSTEGSPFRAPYDPGFSPD